MKDLSERLERENARILALQAQNLKMSTHKCPDVSRLVDRGWADGRIADLQNQVNFQSGLVRDGDAIIFRLRELLQRFGHSGY
jgi:hypothetical protein